MNRTEAGRGVWREEQDWREEHRIGRDWRQRRSPWELQEGLSRRL